MADRLNNRMQVFTLDGKFQREIFIERKTKLLGTAFSVAFSPDARQELLYLADTGNGKIHIFDRQTLNELGSFWSYRPLRRRIHLPAQRRRGFKGNVYTTEVGNGRRVQKFLRK